MTFSEVIVPANGEVNISAYGFSYFIEAATSPNIDVRTDRTSYFRHRVGTYVKINEQFSTLYIKDASGATNTVRIVSCGKDESWLHYV